MMKSILTILTVFGISLSVSANDEYVAVDPAQLDTINGQTLLIAAYCIVLGMLLSYWVYMVVRERNYSKEIKLLEKTNGN